MFDRLSGMMWPRDAGLAQFPLTWDEAQEWITEINAEGWNGYWSSTTSVYNAAYGWVIYMQNGEVGVGYKANPEFNVMAARDLKRDCVSFEAAETDH